MEQGFSNPAATAGFDACGPGGDNLAHPMSREDRYRELISGGRRGPVAWAARALLRPAGAAYGVVLRARNWYYDRLAFPHWLDAPVISVGNLTVGGTGKTPMVIHLCRMLRQRGRKPAVLARGYKASREGLADELLLISVRVPDAVAVANPNRALAGQFAIQEHGAKAIILDDGFQHRRVGRDLDIVLIDATLPFGYSHVLPRGLLREPLRGLARAELVIITRADRADAAALREIEATIRRYNADAPILHAEHGPTGLFDFDGRRQEPPSGRVGAVAGIARPDAFAATLAGIGLTPAATWWFDDHYAYTPADLTALVEWARRERLDALVVTEKDAVKLAAIEFDWPLPVVVLRIDIRLHGDGDKILADLIDRVLRDHEEHDEPDA